MNYIKKLGLMLMVFMLLIVSANATQILVGDESSLPTVPSDAFTERIYSMTFTTLQDETSQQLTERIIIDEAQKTLFTTQILNTNTNGSLDFNFYTISVVGAGVDINSETFTLAPGEQKTYGVLTSIDKEEFEIRLTCTDGCSNATINSYKVIFQALDEKDETVGSTIAVFVGYVSDLIEINLSLWRLGFYLIIFFVFIGFLGSIIFIIMKAIEWAEKLGQKKKRHFYRGRSND